MVDRETEMDDQTSTCRPSYSEGQIEINRTYSGTLDTVWTREV